jgi:dehydrogenase/reductase SDR family protein 12
MARYRGTVVSERSLEDTFDYLAEFSNAAEWDPGVSHAARLDDGPVGLGSRFRLQVRIGRRTTPLEYRVVSIRRPDRVVLLAESATIRSEDTITLAPRADGGCVLTYHADLRLLGTFSPFDPLVALPFRRIGDRALVGLRSALGAEQVHEPDAGGVVARLVDEALEATVVGSFSSVGPEVRSRVAGWSRPPSLDGAVVLGARVVFVARDGGRADTARSSIEEAVPGADVSYLLADMGELDQVREVAARVAAEHDQLDVLVHNAGALSREYTTTGAGTELTVASQVVAPFLLTGLLLPLLRASVPARVIQVSSGGMYTQRFDLATLESEPAGYDGTVAYARAKRAQLVLMHEWVRRFDGSGIAFNAMHPGWADTPGIRSGLPGFARVMGPVLRTPEQGADTVVWLASDPGAGGVTGGFWLDRRTRWEHKVPWTWLDRKDFELAGSQLWAWCAERSEWDEPATVG